MIPLDTKRLVHYHLSRGRGFRVISTFAMTTLGDYPIKNPVVHEFLRNVLHCHTGQLGATLAVSRSGA